MKTRTVTLISLAIFCLSLCLRVLLVSKGPYHSDTLALALKAQETLKTGQLAFMHGPGYPMTVICASVFVYCAKLFSVSDPVVAVNMMSVVLSAASVAVFFLFVRRLFDGTTAVLGSALFSVLPVYLGVSVYGKGHAPAMLFLFLGIYFLIRFLDGDARSGLWWSAAFLACSGAARAQDLVILGPALGLLFLRDLKWKDGIAASAVPVGRMTVFLLSVFLLVAAVHLPYVLGGQRQVYFQQLGSFLEKHAQGNFMGLFSSRLIKSFGFMAESMTIPGLVLSFIGLGVTAVKKPKVFGFLLAWFLVPLFYYGNLHYTVAPRFILIVFPPLVIAQSYLFSLLMNRSRAVRFTAIAAHAAIVLSLLFFIYPILRLRHEHAILPDYARWVAKKAGPDAVVILQDDYKFFEYYGDVSYIIRPRRIFHYDREELARFKEEVDALLARGIPVYITTISLHAYDRFGEFSSFFKEHYEGDPIGRHLYETWHFGATELQTYESTLYRVYPK